MRGTLLGAGAGATLTALVMTAVVPMIKGEEGTKYIAYHDIGKVMTVCSGHTGPDVVVGKVYTDKECSALTQHDAEVAASGVLKYSPHLLYHPLQLVSAISFSYNVGVGTYNKSSVAREFNAGNFVAGCQALLKYDYAGDQYSAGLHNRRVAEYKVCMSTLTPAGVANATNP